MNKRIEKLFNEAGFHKPEAERLGIEDKFEKFAELIVKECADIADFCDQVESVEAVSSVLKRHFGVEE
jgi:hypothetical protein